MEDAKQNILGTEKITKLILKFSIPSVLSFLINALYNIVDQIYIGHGIGAVGNAATNVSFPFFTICASLALLLAVGSASNFNLHLGRGEPEKAARTAGNGLLLMAVGGTLLCVVFLIFVRPLLYAFGVTEEIMPYAFPYAWITILGIPFQVVAMGATQLIRADGRPNYAMICLVSGAVFNIIFDPIFMYTFGWGIHGIALATTLSQVLSFALAMIYILRGFKTVKLDKSAFSLSMEYIKPICALGLGSCLNQLAMTVVQIVMNKTLTEYGALSRYGSTIPQACVGVISKVNVIFLAFAIGIAQGCQPINGFNYGAKQYARVRETLKKAFVAVTFFSTLAFLVFQLFPRGIIGVFGSGAEEYFEFATRYLRIFMFMTFTNGWQPIIANYYTSTGRPKVGIFMSLTRQVLFLVPLLLIFPLFLGIDGVVYAGPVADSVTAALAAFFLVRELRQLKKLELEMPAADGKNHGIEGAGV